MRSKLRTHVSRSEYLSGINKALKLAIAGNPAYQPFLITGGRSRPTADIGSVTTCGSNAPDYGPYSSTSYISLKGALTKSKAIALLEIYYYGSSWIFADRITVVADDFTWKSPELRFYRDHYTKVWEYTYLDVIRPKYRRIVDKIISSKYEIIRFHGDQYYDDLQVTERMKQDISEMLKAIDGINGKS